jgi:hypothetical protein
MSGRGQKNENDPGKYTADIWGTEFTQKQPSRRKPKGKYGTIHIGGNSFTQNALFQGEEIRIPFPDAPVNKIPDQLGMAGEPGTLFARPETEPQANQNELFINAEDQQHISLPVDPYVSELPEDLKSFVTYVPLHLLSEEQRKKGVLPYVTTRFFVYFSERNGYVPGRVLEDEAKKERKLLSYGKTNRPGDINAAYAQIRKVIEVQGLREETTAVSEGERNPLLAILREDEIYIDPYEVTIEEAEEKGYPLLRRDVITYKWWLEFHFDTREQPELNQALKDAKWRWGGYRKQWYNPICFQEMHAEE